MVSALGKIQQGGIKSAWKNWRGSFNLVRISITEKLTFEQRLEGVTGWVVEMSGRRASSRGHS